MLKKHTKLKKETGRWLVLVAVAIPLIAISIDNTVLDLALPSIADDMQASALQLQWVINAYTLAAATPLLVIGALADKVGRKRMMLIGLAIFGIASLLAVLSTNMGMLITARIILGLGGAMMLPSTLSIVRATFTTPKELMLAIAVWSGIMGAGNAVGPIIGGVLLEFFSWHSVFLLNLPFVLLGAWTVHIWVKESRGENAPWPDFIGTVLSTGTLFAIVYGVIKAGEAGWSSPITWLFISIGLVMGTIFVWVENKSSNPMVPFVVFKNRSFASACMGMTIMSLAMMGSLFFISQYLQSIQGNSPLIAAVMMLPLVPFMLIATSLAPILARKIGVKWVLVAGLVFAIAGLFYYSWVVAVNSPYWQMLTTMALVSIGLGLAFSMSSNAIMGSLPSSRAGAGSALNETSQQIGGAFGVAILGAIMNSTYRADVTGIPFWNMLADDLKNAIMSSVQNAHITAAEHLSNEEGAIVLQYANQAFVNGMNYAMLIGAFIAVVALIVIIIFMPRNIHYAKEGMNTEEAIKEAAMEANAEKDNAAQQIASSYQLIINIAQTNTS
ncbi:MAG: DHA2 family efflux MFS transporter permease subunit [Chloroflexi bacterium]|nr:DHA2 family efflux MFS transporter permease subunit [Chloroflexota bacterium]